MSHSPHTAKHHLTMLPVCLLPLTMRVSSFCNPSSNERQRAARPLKWAVDTLAESTTPTRSHSASTSAAKSWGPTAELSPLSESPLDSPSQPNLDSLASPAAEEGAFFPTAGCSSPVSPSATTTQSVAHHYVNVILQHKQMTAIATGPHSRTLKQGCVDRTNTTTRSTR